MVLLKNSSSSISPPEDRKVLFDYRLSDNSPLLEIRALTIDDLDLQCAWMYDELKGTTGLGSMEALRQSVEATYEVMTFSDMGALFMILLDRNPAYIVEVTSFMLQAGFTQYNLMPGDWFFSVVQAPGKGPIPELLQVLKLFFLQDTDINRLLIKVFDNQYELKSMLVDAGFRYLGPWHETTGSHMPSLYYAC